MPALLSHKTGNVALLFALLLPLLLGAVGGGVDYGRYYSQKDALQDVADAAALAGARQYIISDAEGRVPIAVAAALVDEGIDRLDAVGATGTAKADAEAATVTVEIGYSFKPTLLVGLFESPLVFKVTATAQATGSANICVIGLKEAGDEVVYLDDDASLAGDRCAIYANSTGSKALVSKAGAHVASAMTCTAGGYEGGPANFEPAPTTDCPPREDPLVSRAKPTPGPCDHTDRQISAYNGALSPGVYCKGLKIDGNSDVALQPGVYFIKDGKLEITGSSRVTGTDVGFYFYGDGSELLIDGNAEVALNAPLTGAMAGILLWRDDAATGSGKFLIKSPNVSTLVGTIYLPKAEFIGEIDAGGNIADASAYTAIIAERVTLKKKSNLFLNSNYHATPVPVPAGVANAGGTVFLRE